MKKKVKILFDATLLANGGLDNSDRSGIFFAAYNMLLEFLRRPELEITLYSAPGSIIALRDELKRPPLAGYKLQIVNDAEAWKTGQWRNNIVARKISSRGIMRQCAGLLDFALKAILVLRLKHYRSRLLRIRMSEFDVWFSPAHRIPDCIRETGIARYTVLYDAIPMMFPELSPFFRWGWSWQADMVRSLDAKDRCFAISQQTRTDFIRLIPALTPERITVAPLAAASHFRPCSDTAELNAIRARYGIPEGKKYFFSLSTLEPRKNIIFLIRNFLEFIAKHGINDTVLVLGGDARRGFSRELERQLRIRGRECEKIIRTGYVPDKDLSVLYSGALCSVYVSLYEGFGLPPLEAMQCGCPVVVSNVASLPEVTGDAGLQIDPRDDAAAVNAFEKIYFDHELRKKLVSAGLKQAGKFSWRECVDIMCNEIFLNMRRGSYGEKQ